MGSALDTARVLRKADPHRNRRASELPQIGCMQQQIRAAAAHNPEQARQAGGHQPTHTAGLKNGRSRVRREGDYWRAGRILKYPNGGVAGGGDERGPSLETQREA